MFLMVCLIFPGHKDPGPHWISRTVYSGLSNIEQNVIEKKIIMHMVTVI